MARSMWTGSISFGLVNIPIKLYSAVQSQDIEFHQLHDADGGRIQIKRFCSVDGQEVPYEHIVKGYELTKDRCIQLSKEELEGIDQKTSQVEIEDFVDLVDIDPIYYDKTYYVMPDRGASNAYHLLLATMLKTGKVGIARIVLRTKQSLCCLRPIGTLLGISIMNYYDEVVSQEELSTGELPQLNDIELKMAEKLVTSLSTKFDATNYHDERREKLLKLIDQKASGQNIIILPKPSEITPTVNLKDVLEASISAASRKERRKRIESSVSKKTMERRKGKK